MCLHVVRTESKDELDEERTPGTDHKRKFEDDDDDAG